MKKQNTQKTIRINSAVIFRSDIRSKKKICTQNYKFLHEQKRYEI